MDEAEIEAFLAEQRRAQVATINADGTPHVVPLSYVVVDGRIALWTDPASKKIANLRRDPRLTCLVEAGDRFAEFRAVQIRGRAELADDPETSGRVGLALFLRAAPPGTDEAPIREAVDGLVAERVAVLVSPQRTVSWDHRKLAGVKPADVGR
jgi:PPOX class probable F420-dependent enzyme